MLPELIIDLSAIRENARIVNEYCGRSGLKVAGVIKGSDGDVKVSRAFYDGGCTEISSSRIAHFPALREALPEAHLSLIRLPMQCEVPDVVRLCDSSFNTGHPTLLALEREAKAQNKRHGVVLMLDSGDRREGVFDRERFFSLAEQVEREMPHLYLRGIASAFTSYGGVLASTENLTALAGAAREIERRIGRKLDVVSGGSSTNLTMMQHEKTPEGINHIRIGAVIFTPLGTYMRRGITNPVVRFDTMKVRAEIIELETKPSLPEGNRSTNWKGSVPSFIDMGMRKRAILALGGLDIFDASLLTPLDAGAEIRGGSSDHTIVDVTDMEREVKVGDILEFTPCYAATLQAFATRHVTKIYV